MRITDKQKEVIKEAFDILDKDKDHELQPKELEIILNKFGYKPKKSEIYDLINEFDTNGNGTIEFDEFIAGIEKILLKFKPFEDYLEAFRALDEEGIGKIKEERFVDLLDNQSGVLNKEEKDDLLSCFAHGQSKTLDYTKFIRECITFDQEHENEDFRKDVMFYY